jgi:hypothetical protein
MIVRSRKIASRADQPAQSAGAFMADSSVAAACSRVTLSIFASADPSKMLKHFPAAVAGTVKSCPPSVASCFE